ncbi:hypothetical protein LTR84_010692 [Exophiala bonariae]|uniref:Clr5 domain-containing protein n=1 Tax=Exophiala bonariae TaxID=1690606 RepID=A0AAV9MSM4_9EURO|nr:hypothetical protein LTR84_010692 [Exophiala bonariae]
MAETTWTEAGEDGHLRYENHDKDRQTFLFINTYPAEPPAQSLRPDRQTIGSHVQRRIHQEKRKRSSMFLRPSWKRDLTKTSTKTFVRIAAAPRPTEPESDIDNHQQASITYGNLLPLSPMYGNSDPFSAAAIKITATAHQLLKLSYHWQLFLDYPVWASELYNDVASQKQDVRIRMLLSDPAALHCLLASGYYISSQESLKDLHALAHKTLAIQLVRKRITAQPMVYVSHAVYQLLALEMFCGDYNAAAGHLEALRVIIAADESDICVTMLPHLWISDVWLAYHLKRRTTINIDTWDTPLLAHQLEEKYLAMCQYSESSFPSMLKFYAVDDPLIEILCDICKCRALRRWALGAGNSDLRHELIHWLHLRTASVDGRLINSLNDRIDLSCTDSNNVSGLDLTQAQNLAVILAVICYLHVENTKAQYGGPGKVTIHAMFEPLLQHIFRLSTISKTSVKHDLMLWLVFMGAINDTLLPHTPTAQWPLQALQILQFSLGYRSWSDVRPILRRFLYLEGMEELLRNPKTNSLSIYPQQAMVNLIGDKFWGSS